ncbi:MAG: DUF6391 domain-containing protein [Chloroflexota bacterium]|nr:DUF6391 domain-containing protein [Chloroflexota bacterium]
MSVLRRIRIAHAIEHATVAVLHERLGRRAPTIALSDPFGFSILSPYTESEVAAAAAEAVERLRAGEHALAVSELCGSNLAVGGLLTAGAALAAANGRPRQNFPSAVAAAALALVAVPAAGRWVQRTITVEPRVGGTAVRAVRRAGSVAGLPLLRVELAFAG